MLYCQEEEKGRVLIRSTTHLRVEPLSPSRRLCSTKSLFIANRENRNNKQDKTPWPQKGRSDLLHSTAYLHVE